MATRRFYQGKALKDTRTRTAIRAGQDLVFEAEYRDAWNAGVKEAQACTPTPMVVQQFGGLDRNDPIGEPMTIEEGPCGFAWVVIRPGTNLFARWMKRTGKAEKNHGGGLQIWIGDYGQSYEKKIAHAKGMAKYLEDGTWAITATALGRLD